jgi:hypothetical protein
LTAAAILSAANEGTRMGPLIFPARRWPINVSAQARGLLPSQRPCNCAPCPEGPCLRLAPPARLQIVVGVTQRAEGVGFEPCLGSSGSDCGSWTLVSSGAGYAARGRISQPKLAEQQCVLRSRALARASSSSNALACFKSSVSKPSVTNRRRAPTDRGFSRLAQFSITIRELRSGEAERLSGLAQVSRASFDGPRSSDKCSASEVLKLRLNQSYNHSKNHRGRNTEHERSICRFQRPQQSPRRRHNQITGTQSRVVAC